MDLLLWRHAQAHEALAGFDDMSRPLTQKGEGQAARVATWLDRQLPESARVLVSPALRTEQTARALKRKFKLRDELVPESSADDVLALIKWLPETGPQNARPVLLVGHQPYLGQIAARLLDLPESACNFHKGALWWLRGVYHDGQVRTTLLTVISPQLI
jgi:phosphohistidine phosphatase